MHTFPLTLHWSAATAGETRRNATVSTDGKHDISVSSAPAYEGDASRWNPEDMFGASLATCHMLTYLALCRKVGVEILDYRDDAQVTLDTVDKVTRVTSVALRPTITIAATSDADKARAMFEKAHKYCFIAQSITSEVVMEPTVVKG